jgi:chromosome segregation ATPase
VRNVKDESEADLERTDELPSLDVASYEAELNAGNLNPETTDSVVTYTTSEGNRKQPLTELPPPETLRDIEAWIAAQEARARTYERVLAELEVARDESQVRADSLALELEVAQTALHTALSRANDGERAALEHAARARAAEERTTELQIELEKARHELTLAAERVSAATAELAQTNESLVTKARQQDEMQQRQSELVQALSERSDRITEVERELATLRADIAETNRELAQRAEHIAAIQKENESRQLAASAIGQERDALAMRVATLLENVQSNEWKRNVWEGIWHDLDAELVDARTLLGRVEAERAGFAAMLDKVSGQLTERDTVIAHLEADRAAQRLALSELTESGKREQQTHATKAQELRVHGETLTAEIKELEERCQRSTQFITARELELSEARATRSTLEEMLRTVQASESTQAARVAELEALTSNLGHALQAQTEATKRANALIEARERDLADEHARADALGAQVQAAIHRATDLTTLAQSTEIALNRQRDQLAISQDRLADFEREAAHQSERLATLQSELTQAKVLAEQTQASRHVAENELERVRNELQRETERAATLDDTQRKLALELERTRGALDERELQLRRLERYASSTSQVLSRIRVGIERDSTHPSSETPEFPEGGATLIPLDDSDAPALPLARRTTIGRAPESDICLTDSSISRCHAIVTIGPKGAFIEDAHSVNGVSVNRRRIRHARLADGDVIELGLRRFRFTTSTSGKKTAGIAALHQLT